MFIMFGKVLINSGLVELIETVDSMEKTTTYRGHKDYIVVRMASGQFKEEFDTKEARDARFLALKTALCGERIKPL
jgi:hypothetical protein